MCSCISISFDRFSNDSRSRLLFCLIVFSTLWAQYPIILWYFNRLGDGGDEPLGLWALVLGIGFSVVRGFPSSISWWRPWGASVCVTLSLLDGFPPLVRGWLAVVTLSLMCIHGRGWMGLFALLSLSLPWVSSLQFYLGYPLRLVIGKVCEILLGLCGYVVEAQGTVLLWRGELVIIDAPCSGVQMIWVAAIFCAAITCWIGLDNTRFLKLVQWTSLWVFIGNVLRNFVLFLFESRIWRGPVWFHDAIGLLIFVGVLALVYRRALGLNPDVGGRCLAEVKGVVWRRGAFVSMFGYVSICIMVTFVHVTEGSVEESSDISSLSEDDWSWFVVDSSWQEVPLTGFESRYSELFPGRIASFKNGDRSLILREVDRPTRMLHSAKDCYQAMGYQVKSMPIVKKMDGTFWSRSSAERGGDSVVIRERIISMDGQSWTDVSSWYWSAVMGKSRGAWYSITEVDHFF